jgi:hypothetical protein
VLNPKIAKDHEFLHELLLFLKKMCKNIVKDEQIVSITNSIYQISTIMNSILKIIEAVPVNDTYLIFTLENSMLVVDIFSLLMPKSQEILRDFNIIDKIMNRMNYDLNLLLENKTLYVFKNQTTEIVLNKDQVRFIASMFKLLS